MPEPIAATPQAAPKKATRQPWYQQAAENDLWYSRFLRFVALGPGRSVSLLTKGKRNAYPVPAHWPIQAKQLNWRERATAFDEAVKADPRLITELNGIMTLLYKTEPTALSVVEAHKLLAAAEAGYQTAAPDDEDEGEDEPLPRTGTN